MSMGLAGGLGMMLNSGVSKYLSESERLADKKALVDRRSKIWAEEDEASDAAKLNREGDIATGEMTFNNLINDSHQPADIAAQSVSGVPVEAAAAAQPASEESAPAQEAQPQESAPMMGYKPPTPAEAPAGIGLAKLPPMQNEVAAKVVSAQQPSIPSPTQASGLSTITTGGAAPADKPLPQQAQPSAAEKAPIPKSPALQDWNARYQKVVSDAKQADATFQKVSGGDPKKLAQLRANWANKHPELKGLDDELSNIHKTESREKILKEAKTVFSSALSGDTATLESKFGKGTRATTDEFGRMVIASPGKPPMGVTQLSATLGLEMGLFSPAEAAKLIIEGVKDDAKDANRIVKEREDAMKERDREQRNDLGLARIAAIAGRGSGRGGDKPTASDKDAEEIARLKAEARKPETSDERRAFIADKLEAMGTKMESLALKKETAKDTRLDKELLPYLKPSANGPTLKGDDAYRNYKRLEKTDPSLAKSFLTKLPGKVMKDAMDLIHKDSLRERPLGSEPTGEIHPKRDSNKEPVRGNTRFPDAVQSFYDDGSWAGWYAPRNGKMTRVE